MRDLRLTVFSPVEIDSYPPYACPLKMRKVWPALQHLLIITLRLVWYFGLEAISFAFRDCVYIPMDRLMDLPGLFLQVGKRDFSRGIADIASKFGIMSSSESDPPGFEVSLCLFLSVEASSIDADESRMHGFES